MVVQYQFYHKNACVGNSTKTFPLHNNNEALMYSKNKDDHRNA